MDHLTLSLGSTKTRGSFLDFVNARNIEKYLADFRFVYKLLARHGIRSGDEEAICQTQEDELMYPFYEEGVVEYPYPRNPPPKVRAGDIVEVILCKDLVYENLVIKNDDAME